MDPRYLHFRVWHLPVDNTCPPLRSAAFIATAFFALAWSRQNASAQTLTPLTLDPHKAITQYSHDIWNYDDGLPQSVVQAIVQTPDGYLWLGLEEGLVRFDGVQFTHFHKGNTEAFTYNDVPVLFVDRAGNLWIGSDGGGLLCFKEGRFIAYTTKDGLAGDVVESIYEDRRGSLWIGTNHGLSQWRDGQFTTHTSLAQHVVLSLCEDRAGNLWIGTDGGGLHCYNEGRLKIYTAKDGLANDAVWTIYEDKTGRLWIGTNGGLYYLYEEKLTRYTTKDGLASNVVRAIVEDRALPQGGIWIGTRGGGINRWREGRFTTFSTKQGLSNDFIDALYEDHEGSLWIGTYGGGLNRLRDGKFTNYSMHDGLSSNMVWTVYEDKAGSLWCGTDQGLNRFKDGKFTIFTTPQNNGPTVVTALGEDRAGNLWIGTAREGLYRLRQNNWTRFTTQNGLSNNAVRSVLEDRQGRLWIGTDRGLNLFRNETFQIYTTKDGLSSDQIRYLHEDKAGALWIGTRTGGLNRLKDGQFTIYTKRDGLSSDLIRPIYEDENGVLWIGTNGGGLNRFQDGTFTCYTIKDGLFDDSIFQIFEDARANLWMSCNNGIFRVSKQELNDFAEGKIKTITSVVYGKADGMKTNECNGGSQPAGWKTRDSKLWFPTIAGAAMIDPDNLKTNPLPPPVVVENIVVDHHLPFPADDQLQLPAGSRNLEFHYTGLSFLAPQKVQFKYQLGGYDDDWIDAGTRRTAFYTNIPPGNYTFRVMACNNDGVWNRDGATVRFSLQPYWYQTWLFYFFCLLAFISISAGAYRYHVRQIRQREEDAALRRANAELESRVKERTAALEQAQNFLNSIIDHLPLMLFMKEATDLRFVRFNRAGEAMIGLRQQQMLGKNDHDFFPKEQADFFTSKDRAVLSSGATIDIAEEPIQTPRGTRWLYTRKVPIFGVDGQPQYLLGLSEDITERKATEAALRKSEEQFRLLFDLAPIGMAISGMDGKILRANQALCKLIGYTSDELLNMTLADFNYPEDLTATLELRKQLLHGKISGFQMEKRLIAKGGHILQVILQSTLVRDSEGQPLHFIGQMMDITDRKQAEEALRESEARFRQMAENIKSVFWLSDAGKNEMIYVSPAYEEIWGRSCASLYKSPRNWLAAVHPEDLQRVYEAALMQQASGQYDEIYRIQRPDGSLRWIRDRAFPIRAQNGTVYRLAGISEDITAIKQAEHEIRRLKEGLEKRVLERTAELRAANAALQREISERQRTEQARQESEGRFRQLAENIDEVLWMESLDQRQLLYVSPVYEKVWGRTRDNLYEQPNAFLESVHEDDRERFKTHLLNQRKGEVSEIEYRIYKPDGKIGWIRDRSFPIKDGDGKVYRSAGISEDITERHQMEEQIRRYNEELGKIIAERTAKIKELERQRAESEKLAAAGRMAARIAHEINNPLAGIQSSFQLIKDAIPAAHRYHEYGAIIEREIERIASIVRQMFDLYRPEKESVRQFRLDQTIRDIVSLLKTSSRERGVSIESDTNRANNTIILSEGLLRQVLYNLLQNAVEASPANTVVRIAAVAAPERLEVTIADQGHGIPEELRGQIVEPFFTTKSSGRQNGGLGLGLSVTKSIVEAMGGTLSFVSQVNHGTTFRVELPL
jgi:PAS domain S-box-containing protein